MKEQKLHKIGTWTAGISFAIGTMFLITFLITNAMQIAVIALYYVITAAIVNLLLLSTISGVALWHKYHWKDYLKTASIMLANIPVVAVYFAIFMSIGFY